MRQCGRLQLRRLDGRRTARVLRRCLRRLGAAVGGTGIGPGCLGRASAAALVVWRVIALQLVVALRRATALQASRWLLLLCDRLCWASEDI